MLIVIIGIGGAAIYQSTFADYSPQATPTPTPTPTPTSTPISLTVNYEIQSWDAHYALKGDGINVTTIDLIVRFNSNESTTLHSEYLNFTQNGKYLKLNWLYSGESGNRNFTIENNQPVQIHIILVNYVEWNDWTILYDSNEYNVTFVCTNLSSAPTPTPSSMTIQYSELTASNVTSLAINGDGTALKYQLSYDTIEMPYLASNDFKLVRADGEEFAQYDVFNNNCNSDENQISFLEFYVVGKVTFSDVKLVYIGDTVDSLPYNVNLVKI